MPNSIIQIHSTQRGGSTFLSYMLANNEPAIAPGDIDALFRPSKESHKRTSCACPDPNCTIWADAQEKGEENFYQTMFDMGYNWIIDSAKHINWYIDQKQYNPDTNIKDIIIFKSPAEHGYSFFKRTKKLNLAFYVHYYLRALANTTSPVLVEYQDLAKYPAKTLEKVSKQIDMEYTNNKEYFWEKEDWHTWGGSNTAMIHFFDRDSRRFQMIVDEIQDGQHNQPSVLNHYREIYYSNSGEKLPNWGYEHIESENGLEFLYQYMRKLKV